MKKVQEINYISFFNYYDVRFLTRVHGNLNDVFEVIQEQLEYCCEDDKENEEFSDSITKEQIAREIKELGICKGVLSDGVQFYIQKPNEPGDCLLLKGVPEESENESHWGFCECNKEPTTCLNIEKWHWYYCDDCKTKWCVGGNLFSYWKDENEQIWEENKKRLKKYREIEPKHKKIQ